MQGFFDGARPPIRCWPSWELLDTELRIYYSQGDKQKWAPASINNYFFPVPQYAAILLRLKDLDPQVAAALQSLNARSTAPAAMSRLLTLPTTTSTAAAAAGGQLTAGAATPITPALAAAAAAAGGLPSLTPLSALPLSEAPSTSAAMQVATALDPVVADSDRLLTAAAADAASLVSRYWGQQAGDGNATSSSSSQLRTSAADVDSSGRMRQLTESALALVYALNCCATPGVSNEVAVATLTAAGGAVAPQCEANLQLYREITESLEIIKAQLCS